MVSACISIHGSRFVQPYRILRDSEKETDRQWMGAIFMCVLPRPLFMWSRAILNRQFFVGPKKILVCKKDAFWDTVW
jgi:hypothetical protein